MTIFCMSDIHADLEAFEEALSLVLKHLDEEGNALYLLGDYIHGGPDGYGVLDRIMSLQADYGQDKVLALLGNHEEFVLNGESSIEDIMSPTAVGDSRDEKYLEWMQSLDRYKLAGNTIFTHAGIDEEVGPMWPDLTPASMFTMKYPAQTGSIDGVEQKVVAGHVSTAEISGDPDFHDIYYDGEAHYYIDGSVHLSGQIPILAVDTEKDRYDQLTKDGKISVLPYELEG